jgi:predicted RNA-binding Zn ribbon-like protein
MRLSTISSGHGLEDVLAVANTRHGPEAVRPLAPGADVAAREGFDRLRSRSEAAHFLAALKVEVPAGVPTVDQVVRLKLVREAVRALAEGDEVGYRRRLHRAAAGATFRVDRGELRPTATGWDALLDALILPLTELRLHADRLKVCHNAACGWVFLDQTRNGGMVWCEAQLCGDRMRSRRFRRRQRAAS